MDAIKNYLTNERKLTPALAERYLIRFENHWDIALEFSRWISSRSFVFDDPVIVCGYSAEDIHKLAPFLDGMGVYNFLISLREDYKEAKQIIDSGFSRK